MEFSHVTCECGHRMEYKDCYAQEHLKKYPDHNHFRMFRKDE